MIMYDNNMIMSLKQKKKIWTKDKIEPQHIHRKTQSETLKPDFHNENLLTTRT